MFPKLALLICVAGCFVVYRLNARRESALSGAIWLPTLWMMRCGSRSLSYWLGGGVGGEEGSSHDRIFFLALLLMGLYVLGKRRINWSRIFRENRWLFIFIAYMGLSAVWSNSPFVSVKRWVRAAGDVTMVMVVLTEKRPLEALDGIWRRCMYLLIPVSIVLIKYFPDLGRGHHKHWGSDWWKGVATHKNTLGQLCLVAAFYFFWSLLVQRRYKAAGIRIPRTRLRIAIPYLLMTAWLLNAGTHSRSATCIGLTFLAVVLLLLSGHAGRHVGRLWVRLFAMVALAFFVDLACQLFAGASLYRVALAVAGRDATLTGRTELWGNVLEYAKQQPWLGSGLGAFWTEDVTEYLLSLNWLYSWGPGEAHNGYIEILIQLGAVGLILFVLSIISSLRGAMSLSRTDPEYSRVRMVLLIISLIHNYAESGFPRPTHFMWFTYLLVAFNVRPTGAWPPPEQEPDPPPPPEIPADES